MCARKFILFLAGMWFVLLAGDQTWGIILHPENDPADWTNTSKPHDNVVGRWRDDASCVAVGPKYIITTRHQGGGSATTIEIGGQSYSIRKIINHPAADLRLVELNDANLVEFAEINFDTDEVDQVAVIGGYGVLRGQAQTMFARGRSYTYGYLWHYPDPVNGTQRWGTNKVVSTSSKSIKYASDLIVCQFDQPGSTVNECTVGEHDSGGGWFVEESNGWKVIGLSRGTSFMDKSLFLNPNDSPPSVIPTYPNPMDMSNVELNHLDAVRISSYADWIVETIFSIELKNFAVHWLDDNCGAGNNYCNLADYSADGIVNLKDFGMLAEKWLRP